MSQRFCTVCGALLRADARFCGACGSPVVGAATTAAALQPPAAPMPARVEPTPPPAPPPAPAYLPPAPPPPAPVEHSPAPAAPAPTYGAADSNSVEVQPGEVSLGTWIVALLRGAGVTGVLTVTDRRLLFKPKVAGTGVLTMLVSQLPTYKARYMVVLAKQQIVAVDSTKGVIHTRITVTASDGNVYEFNRAGSNVGPILEAIGR